MAHKPLPTLLRWPYQAYYWLLFAPVVFLVLTPAFFALTLLASFLWPAKAARVGVPWARCIAALIPMRVERRGLEHIDPSQSYVIIVNHQSVTDVIALYAWMSVDFRWVMKQELRKIPLIGGGCARMGHVFIDRSDRSKAIASLEAAREQLVDGVSILFFPEGTRADTPALQPFKKGAFRMAIDLQLPLLPITLNRTGEIMPARAFSLQRPGKAELIVHPPIPVEGLDHDDIPALMARGRDAISSGLHLD